MNSITMTRLGNYGRLGNCVFQAAFLHVYARMHDLEVQAPIFPGQEIFDFRFNPVISNLPTGRERCRRRGDCCSEHLPPRGDEFVNHDWQGYGQLHTSWHKPFRDELMNMFQVKHVVARMLPARFRIGLHLRMGDFNNRLILWRAPIRWYHAWLEEHWPPGDNASLFVACEEPAAAEHFRAWNPVTARALGLATAPAIDWALLNRCDVVLMPNSTFSFSAAMMNRNLKEAWRANLPAGKFIRIDSWNTTPLQYDRAEDYRQQLAAG